MANIHITYEKHEKISSDRYTTFGQFQFIIDNGYLFQICSLANGAIDEKYFCSIQKGKNIYKFRGLTITETVKLAFKEVEYRVHELNQAKKDTGFGGVE